MKKLNIIILILVLIGFILIITGMVIQKSVDDYCNNTPLNNVNWEKCEKYLKNR